jgi:hypothetical protein
MFNKQEAPKGEYYVFSADTYNPESISYDSDCLDSTTSWCVHGSTLWNYVCWNQYEDREKLLCKCGVGSEERGFLILIFWNFDNHGKGDLLPWIMNIWILLNSWRRCLSLCRINEHRSRVVREGTYYHGWRKRYFNIEVEDITYSRRWSQDTLQ